MRSPRTFPARNSGSRPPRFRCPDLARLALGLLLVALPFLPAALAVPRARAAAPLAAGELADPARMIGTVRFLTENADGSLRSRYCYRTEMDAMTDSLRARFQAALAPAAARAHVGTFDFASHPTIWDPTDATPQRTTLRNVVATLHADPGTGPWTPATGNARGVFLVTAHYDAIGFRTRDWRNWADPAPGGDDNASGVAAVLEAARLAAQDAPYPFDVQFVLFDGEELGLLGSHALADSMAHEGARILGVLNMDMIAYNARTDSLVVMTNRASSLLADYLLDTEAVAPQPDFQFVRSVNNLAYSDHSPFWDHGYPAILLIENVNIVQHNPNYHKITDTADYLSRGGVMMARGANICVRALRRLAAEAAQGPHLVLSDDSVQFFVNQVTEGPVARPGDSLAVQVSLMNRGAPLPAGSSRTVRFNRVDNGVPSFVHEAVVHGPVVTGERTKVAWNLVAQASDIGALTVQVSLDDPVYPQTAQRAFPVRGTVVELVRHYVAPNPVVDLARGGIVYELSARASVRVTVYDMMGNELGRKSFSAGETGGPAGPNGSGIGSNRVPIQDIVGGARLAPGVYLYRIQVYDEGGTNTNVVQGKFVLLR